MAELSPITVVLWDKFLEDPTLMYNLFWRDTQTGDFQFDRSRVNMNVGVDSLRIVKVETAEDLVTVKEDLLSKPLLLGIHVKHEMAHDCVGVWETSSRSATFAVLINPLHPAIRQPMEELFNEGADLIGQGKKFCLEVLRDFTILPPPTKLEGDEPVTQQPNRRPRHP